MSPALSGLSQENAVRRENGAKAEANAEQAKLTHRPGPGPRTQTPGRDHERGTDLIKLANGTRSLNF